MFVNFHCLMNEKDDEVKKQKKVSGRTNRKVGRFKYKCGFGESK